MFVVSLKRHRLPLLAVLTLSLLLDEVRGQEHQICDNGKVRTEEDLGPESNWKCPNNSTFTRDSYFKSSTVPTCNRTDYINPKFRCMDEILLYSEHPPVVGDYRPVAPQYGDYQYLPPQRWLHALKLGAVAFLYHPCAPHEQVNNLKHLARSCLWKHVITPYPHLSKEKPLALVSWGCLYEMEWVHFESVKEWLKQNAMKTDDSSDSTIGAYNEGLLSESDNELSPTAICQEEDDPTTETPNPQTEQKDSPCSQQTADDTNKEPNTTHSNCANRPTPLIVVDAGHHRLTVLLACVVVILMFATLFVIWKLWSACSRRGQTRGRYKSVSKYFPVSTSRDGDGMAIPEMGLPKDGLSEREKLLEESDEDEL